MANHNLTFRSLRVRTAFAAILIVAALELGSLLPPPIGWHLAPHAHALVDASPSPSSSPAPSKSPSPDTTETVAPLPTDTAEASITPTPAATASATPSPSASSTPAMPTPTSTRSPTPAQTPTSTPAPHAASTPPPVGSPRDQVRRIFPSVLTPARSDRSTLNRVRNILVWLNFL